MAVPTPTIVTVLPVTVATCGLSLEQLTAKPELAVAFRPNVTSPYVLAANAPNVIVWLAFATTSRLLALPV